MPTVWLHSESYHNGTADMTAVHMLDDGLTAQRLTVWLLSLIHAE